MAALLDTDVMIHLRDGDSWTRAQARNLDPPFYLSAIGRVELENGVWRDPAMRATRRAALDALLPQFTVLDFDGDAIAAYRDILEAAHLSPAHPELVEGKTADRMTAATALAHGLPLVTLNGRDYRDVPGLEWVEWVKPGPKP
jgi:tRNA(fMet)-specific endonuclease VapC